MEKIFLNSFQAERVLVIKAGVRVEGTLKFIINFKFIIRIGVEY